MANPAFDRAALLSAVAPFGLLPEDAALEQLERYAGLLTTRNQTVNLTAIVDPVGIAVRHFADSLSVTCAVQPSGRVVDIGAGAGFPGLVLKIVWPAISLTLIEATGKKAAFLAEIVRDLDLGGVTVMAERAEDAARRPSLRERFDLAVARAVAPLPVLAELMLPFVAVGGTAVAYKSGDLSEEIAAARQPIALLGGGAILGVPVEAPGLEGRSLVRIAKERPTQDAYPRRSGLPAKRPLV
ncbi:MAG: 16S rRNA (guanine(527)-N(7))-methyltransferase RsmG [Dehalococcoidia bacterium]